jgi:hypothetical protein
VRSGLQHPVVASDDHQKKLWPFVVSVAGMRLAGLLEKLAEIFGRNRMQNSDQSWMLA